MELTKEEIGHLANLARLELDKEEKDKFRNQISSILDYVKQLQGVDLKNIEPTSHAVGLSNVLREDEVRECDKEAMRGLIDMSPDKQGKSIKVKAVFGDK